MSNMESNMEPAGGEKRTEVLHGVENAVGRGISFMNNVHDHMDIFFDARGPSIVVQIDAYRNGYMEIRRRGGKIRAFTEITNENVHHCKELSKLVDEFRHLDGVKGGIAINEKEYMATTVLEEGTPLTQVIYSNEDAMVRQGQYIFDTFWNIAMPAEEKIKSIEEGVTPEFIKTVSNPVEIQKLGFSIANSAQQEILILFSTANAFHRQERAGGIEFIRELSAKRGVPVRILTPMDSKISEIGDRLAAQKIQIRKIEPLSQTRVTILIADRKYSLSVELRDDSKESSLEAIGFGTYSNSRATVYSHVSFFDSLWNQTELYEQLKTHDELQREFINIAAHELRTPIQPIIGLADILYQKEKVGENRTILEVIHRNAARLQSLTENLLDVARIESGSLPLKSELVNAAALIKDAATDAQKTIGIDKNSFSFYSYDEALYVNADRETINQVMYNLLSNAAKFSDWDAISITLERDTNSDRYVRVSIRDSGQGIAPEIYPRLFTKFASNSEKGLGLGLFITKGIINAHGGEIWATNNKDGKGATFTFTLPVANKPTK
jgi:signal transduction histidine kinase